MRDEVIYTGLLSGLKLAPEVIIVKQHGDNYSPNFCLSRYRAPFFLSSRCAFK